MFIKTGGLDPEPTGMTGPKYLSNSDATPTEYGGPYEELGTQEIMAQWPQFRLRETARGLYQAERGLVDAGKANAIHVALARLHGQLFAIASRCGKFGRIATPLR